MCENHITHYKSIWTLKFWGKRAVGKTSEIEYHLLIFYNCKSKDANEKQITATAKPKPETPDNSWGNSPFGTTCMQPCSAIQSWWEGELWNTLLFASTGRVMARSNGDVTQHGSVDFKEIIPTWLNTPSFQLCNLARTLIHVYKELLVTQPLAA